MEKLIAELHPAFPLVYVEMGARREIPDFITAGSLELVQSFFSENGEALIKERLDTGEDRVLAEIKYRRFTPVIETSDPIEIDHISTCLRDRLRTEQRQFVLDTSADHFLQVYVAMLFRDTMAKRTDRRDETVLEKLYAS